MRLKLEDIGRMAGVSRSTVSRVVNGEPSVRPEVRSRVEAVIRETGYTPNAAARSLVSNRTGVIGLVIPSRVHSLFEDPYFARLIQGITFGSNRAGVTLSLFLAQDEEEERELYPRVVESGFIDGVIVTATRMGDPLVERMATRQIPLVMVGRPDLDEVSYVDVDNRDGARQAARHLVGIGAQRIGVIGAPTNTTAGADRLAGFIAGLEEQDVQLDSDLLVEGDFSEPSGYDAMHVLIDRGVDAVFAASDTMALGALRAAHEGGVAVPGDVALMGFDGFGGSQTSVPPLTTIEQPVAHTASRAVELLLGLVAGELSAPTSVVLPVELVERASTDRPIGVRA
ncbi:MAG TPA: LacI family DNA-binding transcriptional regulator [Ilumatobacteraceae bacterium]|nr:LacI family DNA-binding transcriptional regulator [Ilumatobacteraceae bacterium]